ncbi:MAG: Signal transduction histidine kinase [Limisphaerales bacterium]|nr:MAG: Signal transduction histidine kinase [Limisphaerales bacterium]KAG0508165.1 MAG: Signal transduction histidine kinase [Limisphaerales bacterium]TXT51423.1 MAG: Response regulator receiver protein [Limisphaerales bacterium]
MSAGKKILIVEDDPIIADLYQRKFAAEQFTVELAGDGSTAMESLKSHRPDVVLLDLQLPQVNGIEVLKFIRATPELRTLPVIVFTNAYLGNMVQSAWKAGANKCLTKAICTPRQVVDVVRLTLAEAQSKADASPAETSAPPVPEPAVMSAPALTVAETERDAAFQGEVRRQFMQTSPQMLVDVRQRLQAVVKSEADAAYLRWIEERAQLLREMYRTLHSLTGKAGLAGFKQVAQLSSALEAFLRELHEAPQNANSSSLRTFAHAMDFLSRLLEIEGQAEHDPTSTPLALIVDDEVFSRRSIISGLEKAGIAYVSLDNPLEGLEMLQRQRFDLVFLDIDMPEMDGFTLCQKLRQLPDYARTPVVFVTGLNDFQMRARSSLAGGSDIIAKPFLPIELAVKSLTHMYKARLLPADRAATGSA